MSRIVLTAIGSLGDLHPKIAIALELRQRGHDAVFATHKEYRDKIEALGFEFHRMRPDNTLLEDPQEMARVMDLQNGSQYLIREWICPNLREMYADLTYSVKDADFIITGEGVVVARMVKELGELLNNPNYANKAAQIGRIIQAENGVGVACDAIEKQLSLIP